MEDRINKLETITTRLMRRSQKTSVALITPYPISNAVFGEKLEGSILRYMFPCDGIISKGMFRLGVKPKKEVYVTAKLFNDAETHAKGFTLTKKFLSADLGIDVKAGDCLDVSISSPEEPLSEVWVAFLWKPTMKDVEAKSFLIDALEELKNDIQKESLTTESALSGDK